MSVNLEVSVTWNQFDTANSLDFDIREQLTKSILGYLRTFNQLPPQGMYINCESTDPAFIDMIIYDGVKNIAVFTISWVRN
jgi:hypothetical protein